MFFKKLFIILLITFLEFVFCEKSSDLLNEVITNPIIFAERKNQILFVLSKNANESTFENLKNGFLKLEKEAQLNSKEIYYDAFLSFGNSYNRSFIIRDKLYDKYGSGWCSEKDKCFESSKIDNIEQTVTKFVMFNETCPPRSYKKFVVIISDMCMPFLNRKLDDYERCSADYRRIILMLPTKRDVEECKNQMGSYFIEFYSSDMVSNELSTYFDMNVKYQSTWANSIFNVLVVVARIWEKAITDLLQPKINYADYDLCNEGSLAAYLQFYDGPFQWVANMTAPVNFADSNYIVSNYRTLLGQRQTLQNLNCDFVNSYLSTVKDMPLESDKYQYTLSVLSDPYPECLNSNLLWNNSNRHFEVVVLGVKTPEKDYSKLISFSNNSLNHLNYYTESNEGIARFWGDTSICRTHMPAKIIDGEQELIPTTTTTTTTTTKTTTTTPSNEFQADDNKLWIIIGGIVVLFLIIGSFVLIYLKLRTSKNMDPAMPWSTNNNSWSTNNDAIKIPLQYNFMIFRPQNLSSFFCKAFPEIFVEEKNVSINFNEIFGHGSTCTVYQSIITTSSQSDKTYAIKIPVQYDDSRLEEVMHELDIVKKLGPHSSICSPVFCTTHREIPCIIFEKMDTNLLNFVRGYFKSQFPPKTLFLQILWQISNALEFISSKNIIHRDVAARNILFSSPNIAKLSDFGLWCEPNSNSHYYFSTFRKKLPFKWLSIEAMKDKIFSEKSDVWSFGIVMYEMWSGGKVPYSEKVAENLTEFLLEGNRLETPEYMDDDVAEIMNSCWKTVKEDRPNFCNLKSKIGKLLENERGVKYGKME